MPYQLELLPRGHGQPLGQARLRTEPADFVVDEQLGFYPEGHGEHVFVHLNKTDLTTRDAARRLSSLAGVRESLVGYSGLKDRHARTSQWFSIQLPGTAAPDWSRLESEQISIIEAVRHPRKLRRSQHRANRFRLRLRDVLCDAPQLQERLESIAAQGVPNYFGPQRFGNAGDNVDAALRMFRSERPRRGALRGILISAARSYLFNEVLSQRVTADSWARLLPGDVLLHVEEDRLLGERELEEPLDTAYRCGRIDASAMLWGLGDLRSSGSVREIESDIASRHAEIVRGLEAAGLKQQRRGLRLFPREFEWSLDGDVLELGFELAPGGYATSVVRELVDAIEPGIDRPNGRDHD